MHSGDSGPENAKARPVLETRQSKRVVNVKAATEGYASAWPLLSDTGQRKVAWYPKRDYIVFLAGGEGGMPINYVVQQGDCIASIAAQYGLLPEDIWNDPANADLKAKRKSMYILFEGDVVVVSEKDVREELCPIDAKHTFVVVRKPEVLHVRLLDRYGNPQAGLEYTLTVDSKTCKGRTNGNGELKEPIAPNARVGQLIVGNGEKVIPLQLGYLNPATEISGVQMRLRNLGFYRDELGGDPDEALQQAMLAFQEAYGLDVTGKPDNATQQKLVNEHGS